MQQYINIIAELIDLDNYIRLYDASSFPDILPFISHYTHHGLSVYSRNINKPITASST